MIRAGNTLKACYPVGYWITNSKRIELMKQTVTEYDFIDAFNSIRPENFSYDGLVALFGWFEEMDDDCGTETELDVIAICCDFTEYENLADFQREYGTDKYNEIADIQDYTTVIEVGNDNAEDERAFIIQAF